MPNVPKAYRSMRKLLQLSVALLLCVVALGARNAHADVEPYLCLWCSTPRPCPGQPASRLICCAASSGKTPHCTNGWDPERNCGFAAGFCYPLG